MIKNLQVTRALAAIMVLVYHFSSQFTVPDHNPFLFGRFGVDIFFVISGFIMVYTNHQKPETAIGFLEKRFIRIIPIYWILTIIKFALSRYFSALSTKNWSELVYSLLFIPYGTDPNLARPIIFVGWSLNFEMLFYFIFAALIFIKNPYKMCAAVGAIFVLFIAIMAVFDIKSFPLVSFASPLLFEFVGGMLLGAIFTQTPFKLNAGIGLPIIAACLISMPLFQSTSSMWLRAGAVGGLSFAIVASGLAMEQGGYKLDSRAAQLIGASSYSLYLTHAYLIDAVLHVLNRLTRSVIIAIGIGLVLSILLSLVVAVLSYTYIETPINRRLRSLVLKIRDR